MLTLRAGSCRRAGRLCGSPDVCGGSLGLRSERYHDLEPLARRWARKPGEPRSDPPIRTGTETRQEALSGSGKSVTPLRVPLPARTCRRRAAQWLREDTALRRQPRTEVPRRVSRHASPASQEKRAESLTQQVLHRRVRTNETGTQPGARPSRQARAVSNRTSNRLQARSACASLYTAESGGHQPCRVPA